MAQATDAWSRAASLYDLQLIAERRAIRALVTDLAVQPADRVIDVATGTGAVPRELIRRSQRPVELTAVDASAPMLDRARQRLAPGWRALEADAADMPLDARAFDVATCAYLLHLLEPPERAAVLGELARVLTGGGRVGVVTVAPPRGRLATALTRPLVAVARRSDGVLRGLVPHDPTAEIEEAGFRVRSRRRVLLGYPSLCVVAER